MNILVINLSFITVWQSESFMVFGQQDERQSSKDKEADHRTAAASSTQHWQPSVVAVTHVQTAGADSLDRH